MNRPVVFDACALGSIAALTQRKDVFAAIAASLVWLAVAGGAAQARPVDAHRDLAPGAAAIVDLDAGPAFQLRLLRGSHRTGLLECGV